MGVLHRDEKPLTPRQAYGWTSFWVGIALTYSGFIYYVYADPELFPNSPLSGSQAMIKYFTGYLVELSLSLDNVFVIYLIMQYFKIPEVFYHRVLFWGILGAVVFRGLMIGAGVALVHAFHWVNYVFALIILYSAYRIAKSSSEELRLEENRTVKFLKRWFPITRSLHGNHFFIRRFGKFALTPLFVAVMVIETSDIFFAIDSIPAIFAITDDAYLIFTSNLFAILGLRSLFFVLSHMVNKFQYVKPSLVIILVFVGLKMLTATWIEIPDWFSLSFVVITLGTAILISMFKNHSDK